MPKVIDIQFENGQVWRVNALFIARDRAQYYATLDFGRGDVDDPDKAIQDEIDYAMSDTYELIDWMKNNMGWVDVEPHARYIPQSKASDLNRLYLNAEMTVRDVGIETS